MITEKNLIWLCGFISIESNDKYRHTSNDRKTLKKILKQLREMKEVLKWESNIYNMPNYWKDNNS